MEFQPGSSGTAEGPRTPGAAGADGPTPGYGAGMRRVIPAAAALLLGGCPGGGEVPAPEGLPIVLVCLDTFRPDRLEAWGATGGITPNLDRFAAEAVVFTSAWAQANETLFSHASLFTGRYASELAPLTYDFRLPEDVPTLASVLSVYGYRTAGSVAGGHLLPEFGLARGFDHWTASADWGSFYHTIPPALAWLDARSQRSPWFLFIHGYDAHSRYLKPTPVGYLETPAEWLGAAREAVREAAGVVRIHDDHIFPTQFYLDRFDRGAPHIWGAGTRTRMAEAATEPESPALALTPEDHAHIRAVYDGAAAYADLFFGLLMAELDDRGVLDEAVVAVISDHGESLGEHGLYNHRYTLYDEDLHVLLMVRMPGGRAARVVDAPVALVDVLPTLLELAGATPPAGSRGQSLVPWLQGEAGPSHEVVFAEGSFRALSARTDHQRLVFTGLSTHSPWLVPLLAELPLESPAFEAVPPAPGHQVAPLREALLAWRRAVEPRPGTPQALSPELQRSLREQGYWEAR